MTDMAHFYLQFMEELGLEQVHLMGTSMGGWIAAEIAAMCPHRLKSLVLVDAAGIKPEVGQIAADIHGVPGIGAKSGLLRPQVYTNGGRAYFGGRRYAMAQ